MSSKLILYDIENKEDVCWSPNTFKPRAVMAYKRVAYETRWISYPDIDGQLREHGQESAETVICPVIKDGQVYIPDSLDIAKYLEQKVPTPSIFSGGIEAHERFDDYAKKELQRYILSWIIAQIPPILDDRGSEYFTRTRESKFGCPLPEVARGGDDEFLPRLRGGLTPVFHALRKSGAYIMGDQFSYADCIILSFCQWIKRSDLAKFKKFLALDADGLFQEWFERCQPYMQQMS